MPQLLSPVSRRALLAGSIATLAAPALANVPPLLAESQRRTLTRLAQELFPHPLLSEQPYRQIVDMNFPDTAPQVQLAAAAEAASRLDAAAPPLWRDAPQHRRLAALAPLMAQPFFQGFRFAVMAGLYANLDVTSRFGYQGPSFEDGGYIERGFDSLPWLPSPEGTEASQWPI
jgi:hypothetical protein